MSDKSPAKAAAPLQQQPAPRTPRTRTVRPPASQVRLRAEGLPGAAPPPRESQAADPVPPSEISAGQAANPTPANEEADRRTVRDVAPLIYENIGTGRYGPALAQIQALTLRQRDLLIEDYASRENSYDVVAGSNRQTRNIDDLVRHSVRFGQTGPGFAQIIAVLHGLTARDAVTDLADGLISKESSEVNLTQQIGLVPQNSRRSLLAQYELYYSDFGIGNDKPGQALYEHISARLKKDIPIRRVYSLLDHPVTEAEKLYYAAGSSSGADEHAALAILLAELTKGAEAFTTLRADWKTYVQNDSGWLPGYPRVPGSIEETVQANLSETAANIVDLIVYLRREQSHLQSATAAALDPTEQARIRYKASQLDLVVLDKVAQELQPGFFASLFASDHTDRKALAAQGRILQERARQAQADLLAGGGSQAQVEETNASADALRKVSQAPVTHTVAIADLAASGSESPEYELLAQQSATLADEIYFLYAQKPSGFSAEILKKISTIWQDDAQIDTFFEVAKTPVYSTVSGRILRPAYNPGQDLLLDEPYLGRYLVSIARKSDAVSRGANRIALELDAGGDAALKAVDELIAPLSLEQRRAIVTEFMRIKVGVTPLTPESTGEDFRLFYLDRNFTVSEVGTRLVDRLSSPASDLATGGQQASERDRDAKRSLLRPLGDAVSGLFFNGRGNDRSVEAARDRFFDFQQLKEQNPEAFKELLAFYGVHNEAELVALLTRDFDARLATRESAVEAAAGIVEKFITLVTRSALVVALGPTGFPGLLASLGSFVTGFLVHSGISGASYDLFSRVNLATLLEEVAATVFEVAKIEDIIGEALKLVATPRNLLAGGKPDAKKLELFNEWLRKPSKLKNGEIDVGPLPFSLQPPPALDNGIAILSGILKSQGTKVLEKGVGNAVAGVDLPTIHEFIGKYFVANLAVSGLKTKLSPTKKINIETEFLDRLPLNVAGVAIHGPPPGAAFLRALISEVIKIAATTPPDQLNIDKFADKVLEQALWSAVFAVSVGTAQSIVGAARGRETLEQAEDAPDTATQLLRRQLVIKEGIPTTPFKTAYDQYSADAKSRSETPVSGLAFLRNRTLLDQYYPNHEADRSTLLKAFDNYNIYLDAGTRLDENITVELDKAPEIDEKKP